MNDVRNDVCNGVTHAVPNGVRRCVQNQNQNQSSSTAVRGVSNYSPIHRYGSRATGRHAWMAAPRQIGGQS